MPKNATVLDDNAVNAAANNLVTAPAIAAGDFKGVNWADKRDNFADDALILSGLDINQGPATIALRSNFIIQGFKKEGANTVRLPVNPSTALGAWWKKYKVAPDVAIARNMKVIFAYWEGSSYKDGLIDDMAAYWQMWDTVINTYKNQPRVYFEPFNEPHGYSLQDLTALYANFLARYPFIPDNRIVLDGTGYSTGTNDIGADSRFDSCFLGFHDYTWFENNTTTADWEQPVESMNYPQRTIVTEFGTSMTDGVDFLGKPGSNVGITYLQGMTNAIHSRGVGGIYWPGLRTGDSYSMFTLNDNAHQLTINNSSGLKRLQYAWNETDIEQPVATFIPGSFYSIVNRNSNKSLDVNGSSFDDGAILIQWDYWGGINQQWRFDSTGSNSFTIINKNSNKVVDVEDQSADAAKQLVQWSLANRSSQQWQITDIGFGYYKIINNNSGLAMDVNGTSTSNGANVIQWYWNRGANQQWQITGLNN